MAQICRTNSQHMFSRRPPRASSFNLRVNLPARQETAVALFALDRYGIDRVEAPTSTDRPVTAAKVLAAKAVSAGIFFTKSVPFTYPGSTALTTTPSSAGSTSESFHNNRCIRVLEVLYHVVLLNLSLRSKDFRIGSFGILGSRGTVPVRDKPELTIVSLPKSLAEALLAWRCGIRSMASNTVER